jgi:hypothetical protein
MGGRSQLMKLEERVLRALPLFVLPIMALQCGGNATTSTGYYPIIVHKCGVEQIVSYPGEESEGNVYVDKPAECPISLTNAGTNFEFSATGEFAIGTFWNHDLDTELDIINANGQIVKHTIASSWNAVNPDGTSCTFNCPTHDAVYLGDLYPAGTAGFGLTVQEDQADMRLFLDGNLWHRYLGHLPYNHLPAVTLSAPDEVPPGNSFDLDASLHDPSFVPPITWRWTDNGSLLAATSSHFTWAGSPDGSTDNFQVTVTDANGLTSTQTKQVITRQCDPRCQY